MSIRYRPEVDGLRAISVVAIIIYHANFLRDGHNLIPGAFLAVEIFFVISGFLITSLILKEIDETGRFSMAGFYERRVRRLLPALVLILAVTAIGAWFILLPAQLVDFAKSLVASLFFVSNFYWDLSLQEYGAESGQLKPLLHTWTLAVEEQFYILFPLMLVLLHRWLGRRLVCGLAVISLASLVFAEWHTGADPHTSFYMLPSRYWELLAGALLATVQHRLPPYDSDTILKRTMAALGLALMLTSFVLFNFYESHHPGFMTIYTVLGTVMVIGFCGGNDPVTRLLASRPFVVVGLMSYSLYLWHFPIFAFARHIQTDISVLDKLVWMALTFVFSILSYRYVERPFRNRRAISTRQVMLSVAVFTFLIVAFSVYVIKGDGVRERFSTLELQYGINEFDNNVLRERTWTILNGLAAEHGMGPSSPLEPSAFESEVRWFSDREETEKVLIVGVSISRDFFNALYLNREKFPQKEFARFAMHRTVKAEELDQLLASPNFKAADTIVMNFTLNPTVVPRYRDMVARVVATGKRVIIASNPQIFVDRNGKAPFDWYMALYAEEGLENLDFAKAFYEDRLILPVDTNSLIKEVADAHGLRFLDLRKLACDVTAERCDGVTPEGHKIYYDSVHWTLEGAQYFGGRIAELGWLEQD